MEPENIEPYKYGPTEHRKPNHITMELYNQLRQLYTEEETQNNQINMCFCTVQST